MYHGGIEHYKNPSPTLQKKCRKFIRAGADLVLCQHSHCIGTVERIHDGTILYGQGNSLFGYREGEEAWNEGLLVEVDIKEKNKIEFRLMKATFDGISLATEEKQWARLSRLEEDSKRLDDEKWVADEWREFALKQASLNMPLLYGWNRIMIKMNRIFGNRLINLRYSKKRQMITMNLMRCESHHEVMETIFKEKVFRKEN